MFLQHLLISRYLAIRRRNASISFQNLKMYSPLFYLPQKPRKVISFVSNGPTWRIGGTEEAWMLVSWQSLLIGARTIPKTSIKITNVQRSPPDVAFHYVCYLITGVITIVHLRNDPSTLTPKPSTTDTAASRFLVDSPPYMTRDKLQQKPIGMCRASFLFDLTKKGTP